MVKRFQFAADEQQKMRQNLQELQCLQFYAKDNITGQVVSQLFGGEAFGIDRPSLATQRFGDGLEFFAGAPL